MRERATFRVGGVKHMDKADAEPRTPGPGRPVPRMAPAKEYRNGSTCGPGCIHHGGW